MGGSAEDHRRDDLTVRIREVILTPGLEPATSAVQHGETAMNIFFAFICLAAGAAAGYFADRGHAHAAAAVGAVGVFLAWWLL